MICVVKLCYAPRQTRILMTCTCNCSMHIQHNVMQLFHANSAPACTRSRSPHNVLHSPSIYYIGLIGASLSEPHIDEFAVNFPYIYLFIYFFIYIYRTSCRKSLPARILRVIASCVNSNHKRTHHNLQRQRHS